MGRPLDPFIGDSALPAQTGVVVIGGGIIGVATASSLPSAVCRWCCARKGRSEPSNRAGTGGGAGRWGATRARCRSPWVAAAMAADE